MRTVTFTWKKSVFEVREDTVGSGIRADYVLYTLFPEPNDLEFRLGADYGTFLANVRIASGSPGFTIPTPDAKPEDIKAFWLTYQALPRVFRNAYLNAQTALLIAANADELTPAIDPNDKASLPTDSGDSSSSPALTDSSSDSPAPVSD